MPIYNLGMMTAGLPDPSMRQASSVVTDPNAAWNSYLADWQSRWNAATPVWVGGGGGGGGWSQENRDVAVANGGDPEAVYSNFTGGGGGHYDDSARRALDAEKAKQAGVFAPQIANQMAQQNAYTQAGGGSFLGGNLNASYAAPNTGLDPSSSLNGMLNTQPWSMPGFGGPMGGGSQAGFGGPHGCNAQPQGWGGPFTARNPWAAS